MRSWRRVAAGAAVSLGIAVATAGAQPVPQPASPAPPSPAQAAPAEQPPAVPPAQAAPGETPRAQPPQPAPAAKGSRRAQPRPGTGQTAPPAPRMSWDALGLRGFSVALVVGDLAGASAPDNLPAGAKKALADMRDFLPYKSYRLLDTHWILCCSGTGSQSTVSGRLRGTEEEEYVFYIGVRPGSDSPNLGVTFTLRETGAIHAEAAAKYAEVVEVTQRADRSREVAELARRREELERRHAEAGEPDRVALARQLEEVKRRLGELERGAQPTRVVPRASPTRQVLDSTFSMKVGETVVIGTSRLKGDRALIALLTAASRSTTAPRESRE